jgi:hypothetical protein
MNNVNYKTDWRFLYWDEPEHKEEENEESE